MLLTLDVEYTDLSLFFSSPGLVRKKGSETKSEKQRAEEREIFMYDYILTLDGESADLPLFSRVGEKQLSSAGNATGT